MRNRSSDGVRRWIPRNRACLRRRKPEPRNLAGHLHRARSTGFAHQASEMPPSVTERLLKRNRRASTTVTTTGDQGDRPRPSRGGVAGPQRLWSKIIFAAGAADAGPISRGRDMSDRTSVGRACTAPESTVADSPRSHTFSRTVVFEGNSGLIVTMSSASSHSLRKRRLRRRS